MKKNIVMWVFIIIMVGLVIWLGMYAKNENSKLNQNNNTINNQNKKDINKEKENNKNKRINKKQFINTNQTVIEKLYELNIVNSKNIEDINSQKIDYTIDYGLINEHNVKIKINFDMTGEITNVYGKNYDVYKQIIDVYVDDNVYNLLNVNTDYHDFKRTKGALLLKHLKVNANNCGILIINNIENRMTSLPIKPFILIYNQKNEFKFIDGITTQYSNSNSTNFDANKSPIKVDNEYVWYCKYINNHKYPENEWGNDGNGLVDVKCIKYNGTTEEVYTEAKDVYIQERVS